MNLLLPMASSSDATEVEVSASMIQLAVGMVLTGM